MAIRRIVRGFWLVALAAASAGDAMAQALAPDPAGGSAVVASEAVPRAVLGGVAFDAVTGDPLPHVVLDAGSRSTRTDSLGRFTIAHLSAARVVTARAPGYRPVRLDLGMASHTGGWVARFAMEPEPPPPGCDGYFPFGAQVLVRDALTGLAPEGLVVLRVQQDSLSSQDFESAAPGDSSTYLMATLEGSRFGPHQRSDSPLELQVVAPGYSPWYRTDVELTPSPCGFAMTDVIPVWLLPTGTPSLGRLWGLRPGRNGESSVAGSELVPDGDLRGIVYDAETGDPIEHASVRFGEVGNLTDASGAFVLHRLPQIEDTLVAMFIGFERTTVPLPLTHRPSRGIAARLALHRRTRTTSCEALSMFGVRVRVRDALTGRAPVGPISLFVRQDSVSGWAFSAADGTGDFASLLASLQPATVGSYRYPDSPVNAEVAAPGYAMWRRTGFDLPRQGCGSALTDPVTVWLLPVVAQPETDGGEER